MADAPSEDGDDDAEDAHDAPGPFARALRDHARGERTATLWQVDGADRNEHPVERFYFAERDDDRYDAIEARLSAPLVDLGAGVGRDVLALQERFADAVVGLEPAPALVETMRERGVERAVEGDMFALRESFERDRFRGVYAHGTQLGLVRSRRRLRSFLADLAFVTTADATAVLDNYDPDAEGFADLLGARADPTPGLGFRVFHFEYEGETGETLLFRPFAPGVLRVACIGSAWSVTDVRYANDHHYEATLEKD